MTPDKMLAECARKLEIAERENERLKLSLNVRTAQRDEAEYDLSAALARADAAEAKLGERDAELGALRELEHEVRRGCPWSPDGPIDCTIKSLDALRAQPRRL